METACHKKRLRIRNQIFKNSEIGQELSEKIRSAYGVLKVKFNHRVGSLLIIFDTLKTDIQTIMVQLAEHVKTSFPKELIAENSKRIMRKNTRRLVKIGMICTLGGAIGALAVSEKTHIVAGSVFIGLLVIHGFQNRRSLLK